LKKTWLLVKFSEGLCIKKKK